MNIRRATTADAPALLAIYTPFVEDSTVSFELTAPTVEEFAGRIEQSLSTHEWLVMTDGERYCGYAYSTPHRAREAYRFSVETSVYVATDYRGNGIGKQLYYALFESLHALGYKSAYAGITMPNPASIALHSAVGFKKVGVYSDVGFKFGQWHDVSWWQRHVAD
ncbi:MAG: arsinothricin resistance N-acetyltransferase ArsN1 family B [Pseudomonadota bacterium]